VRRRFFVLNLHSSIFSRSVRSLCVLNNAHLRRPQHPSIKLKSLLLRMKASPIHLIRLRRLEYRLMDIRIKLLALNTRVEAFKSVLLQSVDQDGVGHLDAVVQGNQVCVVALELFGGDGAQRAVEVVDGLDEVPGEALDGEVFCGLGFALCAFLEVAEVGDGAEVFVLFNFINACSSNHTCLEFDIFEAWGIA
jgi:hypothetical protein